MDGSLEQAWSDVVRTARRTVDDGLVVGTSGNVSARVGDVVIVTPTGVPYDRLGPADLVAVDLATGRQVRGSLRPTSELPTHLAVYRATAARAVVHTHAPHATAVSTLVDLLPNVHYAAAAMGAPILVAGYELYGTEELGAAVLGALREGRSACLMRNHGTLVHAATLDRAYEHTAQLEWMCRVWLLAASAASAAGGSPHTLGDDEMARVAEKLRGYGQPPPPDRA
ncbi:class II aldolase/adducin family protein [Streptomyces sp. V4-01]|uniref:Class II aldolase/adducin family protein n=1 Tax=Actinacidiphila polyblastidii TaxID=3110430 RepID=A0ABU7P6H6_9ACTN|nr:class II aldolase/adducin family protein [Streptomyces sp. V4-01]